MSTVEPFKYRLGEKVTVTATAADLREFIGAQAPVDVIGHSLPVYLRLLSGVWGPCYRLDFGNKIDPCCWFLEKHLTATTVVNPPVVEYL